MFNSVGPCLKIDDATKNKKRLDVARGLISTDSLSMIDRTMELRMRDMKYPVTLCEDRYAGTLIFEDENNTEELDSDNSDDDELPFEDCDETDEWGEDPPETVAPELKEGEDDIDRVSESIFLGTDAKVNNGGRQK
ncbi:MAG: hypothetical protein Q8736_02715, partial [Sweet potato little leaf phytoplasma]|nr:hypothetical protein [Sweet potato little leaf phytoplasma]